MNPPNLDQPTPLDNNANNNTNQNFGGTQTVPNSVGVLVLGILSIVFCWCYGILAIILGIITLVLAGQAEKAYKLNPSMYTLSSYKNMRGGRVCGIIGLCLGALYLIFVIVAFIIFGTVSLGALKGMHY